MDLFSDASSKLLHKYACNIPSKFQGKHENLLTKENSYIYFNWEKMGLPEYK